MKSIKLNKEQQQLVVDNHNLIYCMLNKNNLTENDVEDWYGTCAVGLCKAALAFNNSKNIKFSTYAYICMENEIKKIFLMNNYPKRKCNGVLSLDFEIPSLDGVKLIDTIEDENSTDYIETVEFMEKFEKALNKLNDNCKQIILKVATEKTQTEVANELGVSRQSINYIVKNFNEILKEELKR